MTSNPSLTTDSLPTNSPTLGHASSPVTITLALMAILLLGAAAAM